MATTVVKFVAESDVSALCQRDTASLDRCKVDNAKNAARVHSQSVCVVSTVEMRT